MRINRKLNLVVPVSADDPDNPALLRAVVHASPISAETFDAYFLPISKTYAALISQGLGIVAGPRIADKLLRQISTELGMWDSDVRSGRIGVKQGLIEEIHRLTNVTAPAKDGRGWGDYQYQEAKDAGLIDADDASEVDAALVFFTVVSHMERHRDVKAILEGATKLWGARVEYSSFTELRASLQTSMRDENSGVTAAA